MISHAIPKAFSSIEVGLCIFLNMDLFKTKINNLKIHLYGLTYLTNSRHLGIPSSFSKKNGSFGGTGIGLQNFDLICPDLHCEQFSKDPFGRRNIGVKLRSCATNCPHCIKCKVNLKKKITLEIIYKIIIDCFLKYKLYSKQLLKKLSRMKFLNFFCIYGFLAQLK